MIKLKDVIKNKKLFSAKVEGSSMLPLLHPGDILSCRRTPFSDIATNDILMVTKEKRIFIHRVIYKTSKYLITKGDNSLLSDGGIYPRQVIGKVYQVKRDGQIFRPDDIYLMQSTQYFQEIVKIRKILEKEKIDFVFLKGLPLHLYFEGEHPSRIYADSDVLIGKNYAEKTGKILEKYGYKKTRTEYSYLHKLLKNKETEDVYFKRINNFPIVFDVHYEVVFMMNQMGKLDALYPQKLIDRLTDDFLKEKRLIKIQDENFPILSSENLMIYLALHFFHHNFQDAFRLELLDEIISQTAAKDPELWSKSIKKIRLYCLQNFIYPTFLLLKKYWDTPVPNRFHDEIRSDDNKLQYITKMLSRINIFDNEPRVQGGITRFKNLFFLSPTPLMQKLLIFTNPQVIYSIFWTVYRRINSVRQKNIF